MDKMSLKFRDKPVQSVFQRGGSKFVQLSFDPGQGLTKHRAPLVLSVVVLTGKIRFTIGSEDIILEASEMLTVDPAVEHAVEAIDKSTVLLVLTPDAARDSEETTGSAGGVGQDAARIPAVKEQKLDHDNVYLHPDLVSEVAPELRGLVDDHAGVCQVLDAAAGEPDVERIRRAIDAIGEELGSHFPAEEQVVFPRMAAHVGGIDVGPVARLLEEHRKIEGLHREAAELLAAWEETKDEHARTLVTLKFTELSRILLNHLGKEDTHLFPMASRLLTDEEKLAVGRELAERGIKIP